MRMHCVGRVLCAPHCVRYDRKGWVLVTAGDGGRCALEPCVARGTLMDSMRSSLAAQASHVSRPQGISGDAHSLRFEATFEAVFNGSALEDIPFFAVLGNHGATLHPPPDSGRAKSGPGPLSKWKARVGVAVARHSPSLATCHRRASLRVPARGARHRLAAVHAASRSPARPPAHSRAPQTTKATCRLRWRTRR